MSDSLIKQQTYFWCMTILDGITEGVLVADIRTRMIRYSNPAICTMLGYNVEELGQMSIQQIHPEAELSYVMAEFEAQARGEKTQAEAIPCLRKDGAIIYADISTRKVILSGQECNVGLFRDVTESRKANKALREGEDRFRQVAMTVVDLIWEVNASGIYTYVNPAVERILGYTPQEIIGRKYFFDFFAPDERESLKEIAFDVFRRKETILRLVNRNVHKDGHEVFLETNAVPVLDEGGGLVGYRGADTDVTLRMKVEKALRDSEQMLRCVMQGNPVPQLVIDKDHKVIYWNRALEEISGVKAGEILGTKRLGQVFYGSERPCMADLLLDGASPSEISVWYQGKESILSKETGQYSFIDFFPHLGQTGVWLRFAVVVIRDSAGQVIGAVETLEDITARRKAEEEIRKLNVDLEQRVVERTAQLISANKELESFSYSVSHDLRSPLRGIDGWSLALLEDYHDKLDKEALEHLHYIRTETQRMGRLIDDLLQMSRITRVEMNVMAVNMTVIVQNIVTRLHQANPGRLIEFVIQPGLTDKGDARLLEVALTNLMDNAVKFTGKLELARIEFGQTLVNGRLAYFIRDNGAGFEMAYSQKLFTAFQRMHSSSEFPGTGIGLTIVQNIINRHGGKIWVDASVDHGATFYFTLWEVK